VHQRKQAAIPVFADLLARFTRLRRLSDDLFAASARAPRHEHRVAE
jgi:hypothetical protein